MESIVLISRHRHRYIYKHTTDQSCKDVQTDEVTLSIVDLKKPVNSLVYLQALHSFISFILLRTHFPAEQHWLSTINKGQRSSVGQ